MDLTSNDAVVTEPAGVDDEALIAETMALVPQISKLHYAALARHPELRGLSAAQIKTIFCLMQRAPCTVSDVASGLEVAMATASEAVDRLVDLGMVAREVNPANRRQLILELTPAARRVVEEVSAERRRRLRAVFARQTPTERVTFVTGLRSLTAALRAAASGEGTAVCPLAEPAGSAQPGA